MTGQIRKLGIMTAMEQEFRLIAKSFDFATVKELGPRTFRSASHEGVELTVVPSRIGKVAAAVSTSILIHQYGVDAVLFTGVAGSANSNVRVGDIVVADHLVQHDIDLKGVLGMHRFDVPLLGVREMPCSPMLVDTAIKAAQAVIGSPKYQHGLQAFSERMPTLHRGIIASGDTFICDEDEREDLSSSIKNLKCVEMEGAAVAQVCAEHQIPFVVARIISDDAAHGAKLDFEAFINDAASIGSELFVRSFVATLVGQRE